MPDNVFLQITHGQTLAGVVRSTPQTRNGERQIVDQVICPNITQSSPEELSVYLHIGCDSIR